MPADTFQFHVLRSTSRTNADVYNAIKALPLFSAFLPDQLSDFSNGFDNGSYQLWYRTEDVYDLPEPPNSLVGVMFTVLIDRTNPEALPIQDRLEQLKDTFRNLANGNASLIPAHLGTVNWAKQLDGTNHIMATKIVPSPHVYLGNETPVL